MRWRRGPLRTASRAGAWLAAVLILWGAAGAAMADEPAGAPVILGPFEQDVEPAAVRGLLYARHFTLQQPYVYSYLRTQPEIREGFLLVLEVDPVVAAPRDVDVAVLFAGDTPVHRTNTGYPSGRMVVIVPDWIDLAQAPVYFGSMELPERIDRVRGLEEQTLASRRGAVVFAAADRAAAFSTGGDALACRGSVELFRAVADLIDRYAPQESELASLYRTPLVEP